VSDKESRTFLPRRSLILGAALLAASAPSWAIFGVWRRAARRTVFLAGATTAAVASTEAAAATAGAAAANQAAAARSAADASAAAAQQAKTAAAQAQAGAAQANSPQQKLKELQSLYDQKLISASDYEAAKKKILSQLTQ
jgi:hypothetical protein